MATTAIHRLTLDPMENVQMPSSQKLQILLKPNCPYVCTLDGPLQTLRFLFRYEIQNGGYGRT